MSTGSSEVRAFDAMYASRARDELANAIIPFWLRAIDEQRGGIFTCWNNTGTQLASHDKFTWSQGRFVWLFSRLSDLTARGLLPGDPARLLGAAAKAVQFLQAHAFLDDGRCAFLLSESGEIREAFPGAGPAPSIYADCFVAMGFAEYARVTGDRAVLDMAWRMSDALELRLHSGVFPSHPYPIPEDCEALAPAMIRLNLAIVLHEACARLDDARRALAAERKLEAVTRIFERFLLPEGRFAEFQPRTASAAETLLLRHANPGHALEVAWMLLLVARDTGREAWLRQAAEGVRRAFELGWDERHGGLLRFVDSDGGPPTGAAHGGAYEDLVRTTWDTKLWWVHSEALFAALLSHRLTADPGARGWFERVWDYTFTTFPNPNRAVGEWIQIRDRRGEPLERVVALPVKDPYHVARNLLQVLELLAEPAPQAGCVDRLPPTPRPRANVNASSVRGE